jgi:uncharacterized protein YvpB
MPAFPGRYIPCNPASQTTAAHLSQSNKGVFNIHSIHMSGFAFRHVKINMLHNKTKGSYLEKSWNYIAKRKLKISPRPDRE